MLAFTFFCRLRPSASPSLRVSRFSVMAPYADKEEVLSTARDAIRQAELIVKLYELRRETVMRQARSYVGGEFMPRSVDELARLVSAGGKNTGYILQVYGYWDMVAGFVVHGALKEGLVYDTCQEMYFQYAKIQPYLAGFRERMHLPEWMRNIERVVEGSAEGRERLNSMLQSISSMEETREQSATT